MAIRERALVMTPPRIRLRGDVHTLLMIGQAILVALVLRLYFVLRSDFPLNDGGLFYSMVRDLQHAHYRLPAYTSYNLDGIPFAYPPLAFYLVGLIDSLGPWSLLSVMRFFPVTVSVLGLGAFVLLCRAMLRPKAAIVPATFAFALLPMAFVWQVMGGGITRSLGQLFSILALWQAYLLYTRGDRRHVLWLAILASCTVLSHPEAAWFTAYSIPLLYVFLARDRHGLINSILAGLGTLAVTAPWWVTVLIRRDLDAQAGQRPWLAVLPWNRPASSPRHHPGANVHDARRARPARSIRMPGSARVPASGLGSDDPRAPATGRRSACGHPAGDAGRHRDH